MKKIVMTLVVALATVCVLAQAQERGGRRGGGERRAHMRPMGGGHMMAGSGTWVLRLVADKAALGKLGVTDEAQCAKILDAVKPLKEQGEQLEQKLRDALRERMQLQRAFLKDKDADAQALIAKVKEAAGLRAEQEVLSVKVLAVLRDNLTPEQLANVRPFSPMMRPGGSGGERRGPRGDGERPRRRPAADK